MEKFEKREKIDRKKKEQEFAEAISGLKSFYLVKVYKVIIGLALEQKRI